MTEYIAKYWRCGVQGEQRFLDPLEAAWFLEAGVDNGECAAIGVFDSDGNDLGYEYGNLGEEA